MPKRARPKTRKPSPPRVRQTPNQRLAELVKAYRKKTAIAAACYVQADELLAEILAKCPPGKRVPLGDGLYAVIVDLFAESDKCFKPVVVKRFELQVQDSTGRAVRMRDRKRAG
jgi:hypothetical protein